jgi:hypothetical protein
MSTAATGRGASTYKTSLPASEKNRVENIREITEELLADFPYLKVAPDAMYWLMATWGAESRWRLLFPHGPKGNLVYNSLHYTASPPARESVAGAGTIKSTGTLIGNGYQYSNVIQNLWNKPTVTVEERNNIKEGWYPHGITACMGTYHVKGCPNNRGEWRHYPEAVAAIGAYGLEVEPGQSIYQTLFSDDNYTCRRRSIASGMIIFNFKYRRALETSHRGNPVGAMQIAIGNFLGKFGTRDNNGISPEDRVRQLNATSGSIVTMLTAVGLRRTGDTTELAQAAIDMYDKSAKASGSTTVSNKPAAGATTSASSEGVSKKTPGCEVV